MKFLLAPSLVLAAGLATLGLAQDAKQEKMPDMAAMMAKAAKYTQPGKHHKVLERFLGDWNYTMTFAGNMLPPTKGTAKYEWLIEGRWLQGSSVGPMMGQTMKTYSWLGYDNMKMSYVTTYLSSMDTAMNRAEGDLTKDGNTLISCGTLDEYLTGEHDKMVKYVTRFISDDEFHYEVHDLPIGESNTKVIDMVFTRAK